MSRRLSVVQNQQNDQVSVDPIILKCTTLILVTYNSCETIQIAIYIQYLQKIPYPLGLICLMTLFVCQLCKVAYFQCAGPFACAAS